MTANECGRDEDGGGESAPRQLFHTDRNSSSISIVKGDHDAGPLGQCGLESGTERDHITIPGEEIEVIGKIPSAEV
jgi:hypothetical protein